MNSFKNLTILLFLTLIPIPAVALNTLGAVEYGRQLAIIAHLQSQCVQDPHTQPEEHCGDYGCIICYKCAKGPIDHIHRHEYRNNKIIQPIVTYIREQGSRNIEICDALVDAFNETIDDTAKLSYEDLVTLYKSYRLTPKKADQFKKMVGDTNPWP